MKPILFNTEMVRAILEDRKTMTRRVVKLKYSNTHLEMRTDKYGTRLIELQNEEPGITTVRNPDGTTTHKLLAAIERTPPYRPSDILYVRETWAKMECSECSVDEDDCESSVERNGLTIFCDGNMYVYKATDLLPGGYKWRPSIHMPREAARIFLRVTDVRVERLQEITPEQLRAEGFQIFVTPSECENSFNRFGAVCDYKNKLEKLSDLWNACYAKPQPVKVEGVIHHYESYPWEDIQETRTYRGKPWYVIGNPWAWVIEFERCEKPEGD